MNRHPILIRNIKHLTDARYFAAMGVDWISLPLNHDPASFASWHALTGWIEGVRLAAEFDVNDEMLFAKAIIDAKPAAIVSGKDIRDRIPAEISLFLEVDRMDKSPKADHAYFLLSYDQFRKDGLSEHIHPSQVFLVADWTPELLEEVLASGYAGGFCFSGGEEEEVGMRDYEVMDSLLGMVNG